MKGQDKTKGQLIDELRKLRKRIVELKVLESKRKRAEEALKRERSILNNIIELSPYSVSVYNADGHYVRGNRAYLRLFGGITPPPKYSIFNDPILKREGLREKLLQLKKGKAVESPIEVWYNPREVRSDLPDRRVYTRGVAFPTVDRDGKVENIVIMHEDITERKKAEEALKKSEEKYRTFVENITDVIFTLDSQGVFDYVSPAVERISGYKAEEVEGQSFTHFAHPADVSGVEMALKRILDGQSEPFEFRVLNKDGAIRYVHISSRLLREDNRLVGITGIMTDITKRKSAEETIRQLAYYDSVTGLPNRVLFNDRFAVALALARRNKKKLVVMLLDLDYFKNVNDRLGHSVGDQLLRGVGERITTILRKSDTVARMGGDEFMILLTESPQIKDTRQVANKILESVRAPFEFDNHKLNITTSIGIAVYPEGGEDTDALMKNADIAMYVAKARGRNNYQRWTPKTQR